MTSQLLILESRTMHAVATRVERTGVVKSVWFYTVTLSQLLPSPICFLVWKNEDNNNAFLGSCFQRFWKLICIMCLRLCKYNSVFPATKCHCVLVNLLILDVRRNQAMDAACLPIVLPKPAWRESHLSVRLVCSSSTLAVTPGSNHPAASPLQSTSQSLLKTSHP